MGKSSMVQHEDRNLFLLTCDIRSERIKSVGGGAEIDYFFPSWFIHLSILFRQIFPTLKS